MITYNQWRMFFNHIQCWRSTIQPCVWSIRGHQFGAAHAFQYYTRGIDSYYIDGVSLTRGAAERHQHIWTFAAGLTEVNNTNPNTVPGKCPCDISCNYDRVPAFVGNDY